jgi:hypothetical protein
MVSVSTQVPYRWQLTDRSLEGAAKGWLDSYPIRRAISISLKFVSCLSWMHGARRR